MTPGAVFVKLYDVPVLVTVNTAPEPDTIIFVIVPAIGVEPPTTANVMLTPATKLCTVQLVGVPPNKLPEPLVAVIGLPLTIPVVALTPVIVATHGLPLVPAPVTVPIVPVVLAIEPVVVTFDGDIEA